MFTCGWACPARWPIRPIQGFWGAKFTKMGDFLPWTPMNSRAKFYAASSILGGEIRSLTVQRNKQTNKKQVKLHTQNSKRYIHTLAAGMCG